MAMTSIILFVGQLGLALYILIILILVMVYAIKNLSAKPIVVTSVPENDLFEHSIAIVFYDFASENEILLRVQELQSQHYQKYTAYFFIKTPIIETNNLENIKITRPYQATLSGLNFLEIAKQHFIDVPDAVIALKSSSSIAKSYLHQMNLNLFQHKKAIQSQVIINGNNESLGVYQKVARDVLNLIDREVPNTLGISAAIWEQGFMLSYPIFKEINFQKIGSNDKLLQAELICRSVKIEYNSNARIFGKALRNKEFQNKKQSQLKLYWYNIQLGFALLWAGLRNPNIDKIVFGFNYLRPPLYLSLVSCILLFGLNLLQKDNSLLFNIIALIGVIYFSILLIKGRGVLKYLKQIVGTKHYGFGASKHQHSHAYTFLNNSLENHKS